MSTEPPDSSHQVAEIRADLNRRAWRIMRARLIQLPAALVLIGGLIFAMAAGGAFNHHQAPYALQNATSSRTGGVFGLKIDAVLTSLYLLAVLFAYAVRRLSAPRRARRALARESVI
ncbi:MAG: hypothetical protein ACYC1I_12425 [Acidimicrobiales bacterium]